jgi:lipopolysaccharide export system protein LptC
VIYTLRVIWERISLYLPVILMAVLALGTYWLVRSTPFMAASNPETPARHEPDYFMHQFSVKTFDSTGHLKSEVKGIDARHFPDTDTLEIEQIQIRSFNPEGRLSTATANKAVTNGDASEVQLSGQARVIREAALGKMGETLPRLEYRGEFLHAFIDSERIKSHKPVELLHGNDQFNADTLDFDNLDRVMELKGRVKGRLVPRIVK